MTEAREGQGQGQKLRIAYLLQQFPLPTETFAVSDIAALLAQGHHVSVFTMKRTRPDEQARLKKSGVPECLPIDRLSLAGAMKWPALLWRFRRTVPVLLGAVLRGAGRHPKTAVEALLCIPRVLEIGDHIARSDFDVVHAFWARHVGLVLPLMQATGTPALRSAFAGAYDLVADDFLVDATLGATQAAFSHAEVNRAYLERKTDPANVAIIRRGIPLPEFGDEEQRDSYTWMTASSLIRHKNVEGVMRAFAVAREREPKLKLRVFGEGPDRPRLERLARELGCADAVTFGGHVRRDELFAEMQRASAFLLLSTGEWERLPNVLKEALWAGCAVISSSSPGIEELIPGEGIGHVVDPRDAGAAARAVEAMLGYSPEELAERRRRARDHVAEHFSSDQAMRCYAETWLSKRRSRGSAA
ncbi:MAG TPA: glycosyltransferase [Sphingomicrobium sp.]|nr:glycosyltransferase [Sphingomicrobium sp.]